MPKKNKSKKKQNNNYDDYDDVKIDYAPWLSIDDMGMSDLPDYMKDFLYEEMSDWGAGN